MIVMAFLFLAVLLAGVPVFIALAGSSFIYTHFIAELPDFIILHRMAGGIDSFPFGGAVLHLGRQSDEFGRHHQPHL
jgi:hypothetical protein